MDPLEAFTAFEGRLLRQVSTRVEPFEWGTAFLDDNLNAGADTSSADYHDACLANRAQMQNVTDGVIANAQLVLANSCD